MGLRVQWLRELGRAELRGSEGFRGLAAKDPRFTASRV